ncbi:MAG: KaiC domain-containing protein [Candidatus Asgardarchaeia archaeon]
MVDRLSTGIPEFDQLIEGGIPKGFLVAAVGEPGTGKTIFCIHFIAEGIKEDQPGIYITTEESRESIIEQAKQFNFDFDEAMNEKRLIIIDALMRSEDKWSLRNLDIKELIDKIIEAKKVFGYKDARLVVDSMSAFWLTAPAMARAQSYTFKKIVTKWNLTTIATSQYAITTSAAFGFGLEHIADGIIRFKRFVRGGQLKRFLLIEKMRQTDHNLHMWEISIVNGVGMKLSKPTPLRKEDIALPKKVVEEIRKTEEKKEKEL